MAAVLEGPAPLGPLAGPAAEFQVARVGRFHRPLGELAAVLVDGDDLTDPIADAARSILDGHVVLSRDLAGRGHYPAIDVLQSVSRTMDEVVDPEHRQAALEFRRLLATYREAEDLINIGAYREGANPDIDRARALSGAMNAFLRQEPREVADFAATRDALVALVR